MDTVLKKRTMFISVGIISSILFLYCTAYYPKYALAASFLLLAFLVSLYIREKLFFVFIFLYPLMPTYFAFDPGGSLPLMTAGRLLLIYVILFDIAFNKDKFRKIKELKLNKEIKLIILSVTFVLFIYILNFFTYPNVESFKILSSFLLENAILGAYVFFRLGNSQDIEKAVRCFLFSALFISLTGYVEFILDRNVFSYLDIVQSSGRQLLSSDSYTRLGENRIEGPFGHPLGYCNFLLMAIPMGIYKWQTSENIKVKTGYFFVTVSLLINFLLTLSRGPMLAFFAGALFYFILTNKRYKQILFMLVIAFSGVFLVGLVARVVPGFVRNFFVSLIDAVFARTSTPGFGANSNAASYRLYLFDLAKKLVTGNDIWLGRGMSFFRLNEVYDWVPGISNTREIRIVSIDNFYILKYIEMGLVGLISTLLFIFSLIYSSAVSFFRAKNREFYLCFIFIFISYFVSLFTVDDIGTMRFLCITTGIVSANIASNRWKSEKNQS